MFAQLPGVVATQVGYTGGDAKKPTYASVCGGDGHTEALRIQYDPSVISYAQLLDTFWSLHNPTQRAPEQYKSAIWPQDDAQAEAAREAIAAKEQTSVLPVLTELQPSKEWHAAEWYHQKYKYKNRIRYALLAVYVALGYLPDGSIPSQLLIQQALGAVLFASYLPQLLSVFEKLF